jgi:hypothetical protein
MKLSGAQREAFTFAGVNVNRSSLWRRHAQPARLHIQLIVKRLIIRVHVNRSSGRRLELLSAAYMIDVGVRNNDRVHPQLMFRQDCQDTVDLVSRIDYDRLPAHFVSKYRAVALQQSHRKDLVDHNRIMDPTLDAVLAVCVRWIHITSVVTLIGSFIYARVVVAPALASLPEADRVVFGSRAVIAFRPLLFIVLFTILGSGLYNYLTKQSYPPHYHMWMGIKFLFVLHIFAVSILYTMPSSNEAKRKRWLTGLIIAGFAAIAIADYLRWISLA